MSDVGTMLTETDIVNLEAELGFTLPVEYRAFLRRYNGGRPVPSAFPIEGLEGNSFGAIQIFLRHRSRIESSNLLWTNQITEDRLPHRLLPIARTGCGD